MNNRSSRMGGRCRFHTSLLVPVLLLSCNDTEKVDLSGRGREYDFQVWTSPARAVDILFMVDNSASMDPKQEALAKAFPRMIDALKKLPGGLPEVHIGVISSDMNAGAGEAPGGCMPILGNRGILWGNDPTVDPEDERNSRATVKHLRNAAGAYGCGMDSGTRWIADLLGSDGITRTRNYQGDLADVFSCLAKAVGVGGCAFEHQLQSIRVALNPAQDINPQNFNFLRRKAHLAVVILSDEDDCSADPSSDTNDGMFYHRILGDSASLRCAARGHVCNDQDIPNYDPTLGYTGKEPFVARFSDCQAKDDIGASRDYKKLPLIRVRDMVDSVNQVKDYPTEQILVSGIIGWPEEGTLDSAEYRIDKDTTAKPEEQQKLWDYMPVCRIPDQKSADENIYKAYGGLRLNSFISAFNSQHEMNVFSICQRDFSDAMARIGTAIGRRMQVGCINFPLADVDPDLPGTQANCTAVQRVSCDTPGTGDCLLSGHQETAIAQCRDGQGNLLDQDDPQIEAVSLEARPCWYWLRDSGALGCTKFPWSLRPMILSHEGGILPQGSLMVMRCATCPDGQPGCVVEK